MKVIADACPFDRLKNVAQESEADAARAKDVFHDALAKGAPADGHTTSYSLHRLIQRDHPIRGADLDRIRLHNAEETAKGEGGPLVGHGKLVKRRSRSKLSAGKVGRLVSPTLQS